MPKKKLESLRAGRNALEISMENNGDFRVCAENVDYILKKQQELVEPFPRLHAGKPVAASSPTSSAISSAMLFIFACFIFSAPSGSTSTTACART